MIETLCCYNKSYIQNHSHGDETSETIFRYTNRGSNLILSAPHSTRSFVCKKEKVADLFTGALAQMLGEINDISTIIRTKYTPYKALVSDFIVEQELQNHYFWDIHGFNQDIGYDICLGIYELPQKDYPHLQRIIDIAGNYGLKTIVNHPNYSGTNGLCGRYQRAYHKPNVIQIELMQYLRDFYNYPEVVRNTTIPFFNEIINDYM